MEGPWEVECVSVCDATPGPLVELCLFTQRHTETQQYHDTHGERYDGIYNLFYMFTL